MSYTTITNQIKTQLETITDFNSQNVAIDDYTALSAGQQRVLIIEAQDLNEEDFAMGGEIERTWVFVIKHYTRINTDLSTTLTNQATERQGIIDVMEQYPDLGGLAGILIGGRINGMTQVPDSIEIGGVSYKLEEFIVNVTEIASVVEA